MSGMSVSVFSGSFSRSSSTIAGLPACSSGSGMFGSCGGTSGMSVSVSSGLVGSSVSCIAVLSVGKLDTRALLRPRARLSGRDHLEEEVLLAAADFLAVDFAVGLRVFDFEPPARVVDFLAVDFLAVDFLAGERRVAVFAELFLAG